MVDVDKDIRSFIGSKYKLVGVKILRKGDPINSKEKPKKRLRHCQMLYNSALEGKIYTYEREDLSCANAELALGFVEPKYVDIQPRIQPSDVKGIRIGPLDRIKDADVVLAILTPRQLMEISVLLGGVKAEFRGEIAVCGEATAQPYMVNGPNITLLCGGARTFSPYKDSELVLGLPYRDAEKLAEKIQNLAKRGGALCGCLVSDIPRQIQINLEKNGFEKSTDYFFGNVDGKDIRIYLNKDDKGVIRYITLYVIVEGDVNVKKPFHAKKRGRWTDITGIFEPEEIGINLDTGENLKDTIRELIKNIILDGNGFF